MSDPHETADQAVKNLQRAIALLAPNATNIQIKTVNHHPEGEIEIIDFQADFADGSIARAPRIAIKLATT